MFTSINMATLQDITQRFAENGDIWLIPVVISILGQEAEQEAFYRLVEGKLPSELLFLTGGHWLAEEFQQLEFSKGYVFLIGTRPRNDVLLDCTESQIPLTTS
jgi:hypothetical protein